MFSASSSDISCIIAESSGGGSESPDDVSRVCTDESVGMSLAGVLSSMFKKLGVCVRLLIGLESSVGSSSEMLLHSVSRSVASS